MSNKPIAEILTELETLQSRAAKGTWSNNGLHVYTGQLTYVGSMCTESTAEYVASLQNHLPSVLAEVRRLQDMTRWRHLDDEEPNDGQWCMVFGDGLETPEKGYYKTLANGFMGLKQAGCYPRLWMPLPAKPEESR